METYTWQLFLFLGIIEYKCIGTIIGRAWQLSSEGHHKDILYEFENTKNKSIQADLKSEVANVITSARDIISSNKQISLDKFHQKRHLDRKRNSLKDFRRKSQSIHSVMKTTKSSALLHGKFNISSESTSLNPRLGHEMVDTNIQNTSSTSASRLIDEKASSIELMSYSFSSSDSNKSENSDSKTTILEKLEQRLNKVTEQSRSTPKSVKMINTTEGMHTAINTLKGEKHERIPVLLSKSTSILGNYLPKTVNSLYNETNINLKNRNRTDLKNILTSCRISETKSGSSSHPSFYNIQEGKSDIFFKEKNNYHVWNIPSFKNSRSIRNLTSKNSSKSLIKNLTQFKNSELESPLSLMSLQPSKSMASLGNKDSSLCIENQCHKFETAFESQIPIRVVIPMPLHLIKNSTSSKNNFLEIGEVTSVSEMEIDKESENKTMFITKCTTSSTSELEDINHDSKNLAFIQKFSSLGNEKEIKKENYSEKDGNEGSECKNKDEIVLGTVLNSVNDRLWSHNNEEGLKFLKKSKSEEIMISNASEINNLDNTNEKLKVSTSEGNITTQENMYIFEGLGIFKDSLGEMTDFDVELKENDGPIFDYRHFDENSPLIVFPKQENDEPKYANLKHKNDLDGHYAQEVSTIRLHTEGNLNELNDDCWWSSENSKENNNLSDKGTSNFNIEHKSKTHLAQSQNKIQHKILPVNNSQSFTRSSRRMFKSFLPTIYVTIALYVAAMIISIWFNQTPFSAMKLVSLRNYLGKNDASRTKTEI